MDKRRKYKSERVQKMLLTFPEELHREIKVRAAVDNVSMNKWIVGVIEDRANEDPIELVLKDRVIKV